MRLIIADQYDDMSRVAAGLVREQLARKPASLLVFPTGATPLGLFRQLVDEARSGRIDASALRVAVLDEYAGLPKGDRRSLTDWLRRELLLPLGIPDDRLVAFDPAGDAEAEGPRIEAAIRAAGGLDLAILGLGPNGHIGFNEPGSPFSCRSRLATLSPASIRSNAAYWGSEADVPRTGFTLGLGTLLEARRMALAVSGVHKSNILSRVIGSPPSLELPATIVHAHPDAVVIADRAAAQGLTEDERSDSADEAP